jgi:tetratricopeptide (TPR) repeat protein
MRTKLLLLATLFSFSILFSQDKIEYIDFEEINENILEYSEQKDYVSIIQQLDRINKNDSIYNSTLLTKSYYLIQLEKFEEVIKVADEGLSDEKSAIRNSFMINKGLALAELKRYDEAVNVYDEALKETPKSYLLLYNKAIALEGLKKYDEAVQLYKESIKINPFYPRSHLRLGNICLRQDKTAQGLMCINMYLLLYPDGENSFSILNSINEAVSGKLNREEISGLKVSIDDESFEEIDLILNGRIALNEKYKIDNDITIAYVKKNHALFEKLKNYKVNGGFWDINYVPFYKWIF